MANMSFMRRVYLCATPSVDLEQVGGQIDCRDYTIKMDVYDRICEEYEQKGVDRASMNMAMLMSGPRLVY